jgi:hypothetical protein
MDLQKKFYVAMGIFAVLGVLAWFTMSDGIVVHVPIPVSWEHSSPVFADMPLRLRTLTVAVLGLFALRTWLHWRAEKIREEREQQDEVLS